MGGGMVTSWRLGCWNREVGRAFSGFVDLPETTQCNGSCGSAADADCRAGSFGFGRFAGDCRSGW